MSRLPPSYFGLASVAKNVRKGTLLVETKGTLLVDTRLKQNTDFRLKSVNSGKKSRDHHRYSTPTSLRQKGFLKRLPIAIAKTDVRTNYPVEVEELCQVLAAMLQRRLTELDSVTEAEELA
jgi:hypothetical protein